MCIKFGRDMTFCKLDWDEERGFVSGNLLKLIKNLIFLLRKSEHVFYRMAEEVIMSFKWSHVKDKKLSNRQFLRVSWVLMYVWRVTILWLVRNFVWFEYRYKFKKWLGDLNIDSPILTFWPKQIITPMCRVGWRAIFMIEITHSDMLTNPPESS